MSSNARGAFIVIEGLDRSGKSSQTAALVAKLRSMDIPVESMKFPDRTTPIGKMIDAYLKSESDIDDRAIHLLFSANRWELASIIERTLAAGTTIICDRYAFSGVAFSAASKGLPLEWCRGPDVSLPAPDLTLFLDISAEKAKERGGYGLERYEKEEIQKRVREIFVNLGSELPVSGPNRWVRVDASHHMQHVEDKIWNEVSDVLSAPLSSVGKLWTTQVC